jgi:hypothetical protein
MYIKWCKGSSYPVHVMRTYRGSGGRAPLILSLDSRRMRGVNFTPHRLTPKIE